MSAKQFASHRGVAKHALLVPDVVEIVLAHIEPYEVKSLLSVCKTWHPIVERRLFGCVRLVPLGKSSRKEEQESIQRWCEAIVAGTTKMPSKTKQWRGVVLGYCSNALAKTLDSFCPHLRHLSTAAGFDAMILVELLPRLSFLESLTLLCCNYHNQEPNAIDQILLALKSSCIISGRPALKRLCLTKCYGLTRQGLRDYTAAFGSSLLHLSLNTPAPLSDGVVEDIARFCPALRSLYLTADRDSARLENDENHARRVLASLAIGCPELQTLKLNNMPSNATRLGNSDLLEPFARLKRIEVVELTDLPWLTVGDLGHIAHQASHVRLKSMSALQGLPVLPNLQSLAHIGRELHYMSITTLYGLCTTSPLLRKLILDLACSILPSGYRQQRLGATKWHLGPDDLPAPYLGYETMSLFDGRLPPDLCVIALSQAPLLEHVSIFGRPIECMLSEEDRRALGSACPSLVQLHC